MIANITQGSFLSGVLEYNREKIQDDEAKLFHSNIHNLSDKNVNRVFYNLVGHSKRKDKIFHVSLNFLEQDFKTLGEEKLKLLAEDYLHGLGFPEEHPFISYLHFDKKHPHIHIVTSKIFENKQVLNDSLLFRKSQRVSRKLEKKYNIFNITNQYKRNLEHLEKDEPIVKSELIKDYQDHKIPLNQLIEQLSIAALKEKKPLSFIEFKDILTKYNLHLEETNFTNKGLIYRFENDKSGIKSSNLTKELQLKQLEKTFEKNKIQKKYQGKYIASQIDYIFNKYDTLTYQTFIEELQKKNIKVNVNVTNDILRGFRYEFKGFSFKGQDLPKRAYTMSKIKDKFSTTTLVNEAFWSKYKYKFNEKDINKNDFILYLKDSIKKGFVPLLSENGIYLRKKENYLFNLPLKDLALYTTFNEEIKKLSPLQIKKINEIIKEKILNENIIQNKVGEELTKETNQNIEDLIDIFTSIFDNEEYQEQSDDSPLISNKKKKRKKRL